MPSIHDSSVLVRFTLREWTGEKVYHEAESDIDAKVGGYRASRVKKKIWYEPSLKRVHSARSKVRKIYTMLTMPWNDDSTRLIPGRSYLDVMEAIGDAVRIMQRVAKEEFVDKWDENLALTQKQLGTAFTLSDYDEGGQVFADRFYLETEPVRVPSEGDFRIDISKEFERLAERMTSLDDKRLESALNSNYLKLARCVDRYVKTFDDLTYTGFKSSIISNLTDMMTVMPVLNVAEDAVIDEVVFACEDIVKFDYGELKKNIETRRLVRDRAHDVLMKMKDARPGAFFEGWDRSKGDGAE